MYKVNLRNSSDAEASNYKLRDAWYGMNGTYNFGCMTHLYKKYGCPDTYQKFYEAYIADTSNDHPCKKGRSEDYLKTQAIRLQERLNDNTSSGTCYDYIIQKLIIDTFNGSQMELVAKQFLEKEGYEVIEPDYYQDTKEGIDKFIYKDGKLNFIVQVKPHTFFLGNSNEGLINDRKLAIEKAKHCVNKYGVPVVYLIYRKDTKEWVLNENGKKAHKLSNLIDANGYS